MPADTPDFMAGAWANCLSWAVHSDTILSAYCEEMNVDLFKLNVTDVPAMGDDFILWFNERVWGQMDEAELD